MKEKGGSLFGCYLFGMLPDKIIEAAGGFRNTRRQFRDSLYYLQLNPPLSVASRFPELVALRDDLSHQFVRANTMVDAIMAANKPRPFEMAQQLSADLKPIPTVDE
jgi:hypothetical protein